MSDSKEMAKRETQAVETLKKSVAVFTPPVDIFENDSEILVVGDFPGVKGEDVSIHLEKRTLNIEAHRKLEPYEVGGRLDYEAISYQRAFTVPDGIDADHIAAKLVNGVLKLQLPKSPKAKPRQIQVTSG